MSTVLRGLKGHLWPAVLSKLLDAGEIPTFDTVRGQVAPRENDYPHVDLDEPDLKAYDDLLEHKEEAA
jgi:hypothetical protein